MTSTLDLLQKMWPMRIALTAEEVAVVLGRPTTRGAVEHIREKMKKGGYPGAKKIDGRWQMPLTDLAKILEGEPPATPPAQVPVAPQARTARRRSSVGPYIQFIRAGRFWRDVWASLGDGDDADQLDLEIQLAHKELTNIIYADRAMKLRERLLSQLGDLDCAPSRTSEI